MTEFRRASSAVERLEQLVAPLAAAAQARAQGVEAPALDAKELENILDVCGPGALEARKLLADLEPVAEKFRGKCSARTELELIYAELRCRLPRRPDDVLQAAQEAVDAKADGYAELHPLLRRAYELEGLATYGVKMVEKVQALIGRYDTVRSQFDGDLAPVFGEVVAKLDSEASRAEAERKAEVALQLLASRRLEESQARRPVEELLALSERQLSAKQETAEAEEVAEGRRRAEEEEEKNKYARMAALAAQEGASLGSESGAQVEKLLAEVGPRICCREGLLAMLSMPLGSYRAALSALCDVIVAIAAEPQDSRRRVLRSGSEAFQEDFGRRVGAVLFLRGLGFENCERHAMPPQLLTELNLSTGLPSDEFLILSEPDALAQDGIWLAWHARLTGVASFLKDLARHVERQTLHLGQRGKDLTAFAVLSADEVGRRWDALPALW